MLGEEVAVWAAEGLRVQEALALLLTLSAGSLGLPLRPCGDQQQSEYTEQGTRNF